jgi:hypothetical protein
MKIVSLFAVLCITTSLAGCGLLSPKPVPMPSIAANSVPATATCQGQWVAQGGQWVCIAQRQVVVPYYYTPYPYYIMPYYGYRGVVRFCIGCGRHR